MRRLIVLLAAVSFCAAAQAQTARPSEQSIDTLLELGKSRQLVDQMIAITGKSMREAMNAALDGKTPTQKQQKAMEALATKYEQSLRDTLNWDKLRPMYVQVYQETFTQSDIDGVTAFYKSPAGVAFIDKMPLAIQRLQSIMMTRMAPLMKQIHDDAAQAVGDSAADH